MSQIYNFISRNNILDVHDYSSKSEIKKFESVRFRIQNSMHLNFHTPIGIYNTKIISITNKQLSFLPAVLGHFLGDQYAGKLQDTYNNLISNTADDIIINDHVLQFIDYESISGTGHSYDLMFYILFMYKQYSLPLKLLVVKSDNRYYNDTLQLIRKYFDIEYIYIETDRNYIIENLYCCQTYQNVFFNEVKQFINDYLIIPIINKYDMLNSKSYTTVYNIKQAGIDNINSITNTTYIYTPLFQISCNKNYWYNLKLEDTDYIIYLINKASNIIITWGSTFYININYYLLSSNNKFISLVFHPSVNCERSFFVNVDNNIIGQYMPEWATGNLLRNQVYTTFKFNGEIIVTSCLDQWANTTKLLSI